MRTARISIDVDGTPFTAFESMSYAAAMNEAARSFSLVAAAEYGAKRTHALFRSGAHIVIRESDELVFDGYVDRRQAGLDSRSQLITVSGRSKGQDAIDTSGKHNTGHFKQKTAVEIGNAIAPNGVKFVSDLQLEKLDYQIVPGASPFREVERICRDYGLTPMGMPNGDIKLTNASKAKRQTGGLFRGVNIKAATSDHNDSNRHSETIVRGQSFDGRGPEAMQIEATANDSNIRRKRPLIIVLDGNTSRERAKKHANNHRDRAAGNSRRASITTVGWRDEAGTLWTPGNIVYVEDEFLDIEQDMLIERVVGSQDNGRSGSLTQLSLVDPRAYNGKKPAVSKSGDEWNMDDSEAS